MNSPLVQIVITALTALGAGTLGVIYKSWRDDRQARRVTSGTVQTTEAADLWKVSQGFQSTILDEVQHLRTEVEAAKASAMRLFEEALDLRSRLADCEIEQRRLQEDADRANSRRQAAEAERDAATAERDRLASQVAALRESRSGQDTSDDAG